MSGPGVFIAVKDGIGTITLSNPTRHNAMSLAMWQQLEQAVVQLGADNDVRVIAVAGAGSSAFVAGADISEFQQLRSSPADVAAYDQAVESAQVGLSRSPKPTVACIQGVCMGGGIGIALACDLRYGSDQARFGMPAAKLGLGYRLEGMRRAVQLLGPVRCFELFYTARRFDAAQAKEAGVLQEVFANSAYEKGVHARLQSMAKNAPLTIRAAKAAILSTLGGSGAPDGEDVQALVEECFASQDYAEGQAAFREKRAPNFHGR